MSLLLKNKELSKECILERMVAPCMRMTSSQSIQLPAGMHSIFLSLGNPDVGQSLPA